MDRKPLPPLSPRTPRTSPPAAAAPQPAAGSGAPVTPRGPVPRLLSGPRQRASGAGRPADLSIPVHLARSPFADPEPEPSGFSFSSPVPSPRAPALAAGHRSNPKAVPPLQAQGAAPSSPRGLAQELVARVKNETLVSAQNPDGKLSASAVKDFLRQDFRTTEGKSAFQPASAFMRGEFEAGRFALSLRKCRQDFYRRALQEPSRVMVRDSLGNETPSLEFLQPSVQGFLNGLRGAGSDFSDSLLPPQAREFLLSLDSEVVQWGLQSGLDADQIGQLRRNAFNNLVFLRGMGDYLQLSRAEPDGLLKAAKKAFALGLMKILNRSGRKLLYAWINHADARLAPELMKSLRTRKAEQGLKSPRRGLEQRPTLAREQTAGGGRLKRKLLKEIQNDLKDRPGIPLQFKMELQEQLNELKVKGLDRQIIYRKALECCVAFLANQAPASAGQAALAALQAGWQGKAAAAEPAGPDSSEEEEKIWTEVELDELERMLDQADLAPEQGQPSAPERARPGPDT